MRRPFSLPAIALLALMSLGAFASQMDANIKGAEFNWVSAGNVTGGVAPSYWDIPIKLPSATHIIPGGVTNTSEQELTLSLGSTSVKLPIKVKGIIYRLSSNVEVTDVTGATATTTITGGDAYTVGAGQGNKQIRLSRLESPITHFRPIIEGVNSATWINAFKNANASKGTYQGVMPVSAYYDYVRDGIRIRQTLTFSLSVSVNYSPQYLHDVIITGVDAMDVTHHYPFKVSGQTTYEISASGYFTNGIWMGLAAPTGKSYFSLGSTTTEKEIRYNVTCTSGCQGDPRIIINGEANKDNVNNRSIIEAVDTDRARAVIKVDFDPISQPEFKGETYSGSFVLMFEARI